MIEDEGYFVSDFILKLAFDEQSAAWQLGQPAIDNFVDFRRGTMTRAKLEYNIVKNPRDVNPEQFVVFLEPSEHDTVAVLEVLTVDDLPEPRTAKTSKVHVSVLDMRGNPVEQLGTACT